MPIPIEIIQKYKEDFLDIKAIPYIPSAQTDIILLRWWMKLNETGDIVRLISPDSHRIEPFMHLFAPPVVLFYTLNPSEEISQAIWTTPTDGTEHALAYISAWCDKSLRGTREQLRFMYVMYSIIFEFYPALLGMTWQPELLDIHTKLGYSVAGRIPNLYNQPYCYILHLTREAFFSSRVAQIYKGADKWEQAEAVS